MKQIHRTAAKVVLAVAVAVGLGVGAKEAAEWFTELIWEERE